MIYVVGGTGRVGNNPVKCKDCSIMMDSPSVVVRFVNEFHHFCKKCFYEGIKREKEEIDDEK